jgi:hypothetical protein
MGEILHGGHADREKVFLGDAEITIIVHSIVEK